MEPTSEAPQDYKIPQGSSLILEGLPSSEIENPEEKFSVYVDKRIDEGVADGSKLFREHFQSDPGAYKSEVVLAQQEIAQVLQLNDDFYEDPVNLEIMLAISDSWALNSLGDNDETEKLFLFQTARVLAGENSSYNLGAIQRGEGLAGKYIDDLSTPEHAKESADFARFSQNMAIGKSKSLQDLVSDFGDGSMLAVARDRLGITDSTSETPFRVMVLDAYRVTPGYQGQKKWDDLFDSPDSSKAFVMLNPADKVPTVIMSAEDFDTLSEGDEFNQKYIKAVVQHEYAHTQRKARFGYETQLGRIFDERMVTRASEGGSSHADTGVILRTLDRLLPEEEAIVTEMLDNSAKYPDRFPDFLKYISNKFGLRSTLLLSVTQPKNYLEENGISKISGIRSDPKFRITDLIGEVIEQRAAIDPQAVDRFKTMLMSLNEKDIEIEQFVLRYAGIKFPQVLQSLIDDRVTMQKAV